MLSFPYSSFFFHYLYLIKPAKDILKGIAG